jgi:hypothetical protein
MKFKTIVVAALVGLLAVAGCKKDDKKTDPAAGSGSAATMGSSAPGSAMAGSADMAGSGTGAAMAGSGSGSAMAGSGSADTMTPPDTGTAAGASLSDAEVEEMIKEMLSMFTDITKAAEGGKDCAASAAGIEKVLDDRKPFLDKMKSLSKDKALEDRAKKIMEDKGYTAKLDEASKGLGPVMQKCGADPAMGKTMQRLGESLQ